MGDEKAAAKQSTSKKAEGKNMNGEDLIEKGLLETHEEISPGAVFDPSILVGVIPGIMALVQSCKESSASRQIKRGRAISKRAVREVLEREGYRGDVREAAKKLAEKGRNLSEDDIKAIIDDSKDVPDSSGWWPTAAGAIVLAFFLPASAMANWWPTTEQVAMTTAPMWPTESEPKVEPRATRIVLETQDNCGPCNALIKGPIAELEKVGFSVGEGPENHIQIVDVTGTDHGPTPTLNLIHHGKEFAELVGSDHKATFIADWYNTFIECGKVPDEPKPVKTVSGSNVPSGGSWVYYGSGSLGGHLVRNHGYSWDDVRGKTHGQLVYLHSYAHNNGRPYRAPAKQQKTTRVARSRAYCPTCPR